MVLVVPHEDLYEQGFWPSIFNSDHKVTFRLGFPQSWSPVSMDIAALVGELPNCRIISAVTQDDGYDYSLQVAPGRSPRRSAPFLTRVKHRIASVLFRGQRPPRYFERAFRVLGVPVDWTLGDSLAQIQVVARKQSDGSS